MLDLMIMQSLYLLDRVICTVHFQLDFLHEIVFLCAESLMVFLNYLSSYFVNLRGAGSLGLDYMKKVFDFEPFKFVFSSEMRRWPRSDCIRGNLINSYVLVFF